LRRLETTTAAPVTDDTLVDLVERAAAATPDATAVSWAGGKLTYRELDGHANRVAHRLRGARGVPPKPGWACNLPPLRRSWSWRCSRCSRPAGAFRAAGPRSGPELAGALGGPGRGGSVAGCTDGRHPGADGGPRW